MKKLLLIFGLIIISYVGLRADWGMFGSVVTTDAVVNIGTNSALVGVTIALVDGDPAITEKGIVWSATSGATVETNLGITTQGAGPSDATPETFIAQMTDLSPTTMYYVRGYASDLSTTHYGNEIAFSTIPTMTEWALIVLAAAMAVCGVTFVVKLG